MLNFASALYLGFQHQTEALKPWKNFTLGKPAILGSPPAGNRVSQQIARLMGCESAILAPSTLHLFWDLFGILANSDIAIYIDSGVYPIARWGAERAKGKGIPVHSFPHHQVDELHRQIKNDDIACLFPIIVTDGWCPTCGRPAPLASYLKIIEEFGGKLIIDDTQALGILGENACPNVPYGRGGTGILRWSRATSPNIIVIASLAKGFGAPVSILGGTFDVIKEFRLKSETRVYCSPPSMAVIRAAEHALKMNKYNGDAIRLRLAKIVQYFRYCLAQAGLSATGGIFPVQLLKGNHCPRNLYDSLSRHGVQTILTSSPCGLGPRNGFIITARHTKEAIDYAVGVIKQFKKKVAVEKKVEKYQGQVAEEFF